MSKSVLITGASGLVGKQLIPILHEKGYKVKVLSRRKCTIDNAKVFIWDIDKEFIEEGAIENTDHIIHLAGTSVADKRWSPKQKKSIIDSRVKSAELIFNYLFKKSLSVQSFVSASGVGYYDQTNFSAIHEENDKPGHSFLSQTCILWENAANQFSKLGIRTVKLRIGVVLSPNGGALTKLIQPINMGVGSPIGTGKQQMPWIHIDDLCHQFVKAIEDSNMEGSFNAVAPEQMDNASFTKVVAKQLHKKLWLPNVPSFVLQLMMGEMSEIVLHGSGASADKIQKRGFTYQYPSLEKAIHQILSS